MVETTADDGDGTRGCTLSPSINVQSCTDRGVITAMHNSNNNESLRQVQWATISSMIPRSCRSRNNKIVILFHIVRYKMMIFRQTQKRLILSRRQRRHKKNNGILNWGVHRLRCHRLGAICFMSVQLEEKEKRGRENTIGTESPSSHCLAKHNFFKVKPNNTIKTSTAISKSIASNTNSTSKSNQKPKTTCLYSHAPNSDSDDDNEDVHYKKPSNKCIKDNDNVRVLYMQCRYATTSITVNAYTRSLASVGQIKERNEGSTTDHWPQQCFHTRFRPALPCPHGLPKFKGR